jgi:hypothetical protein
LSGSITAASARGFFELAIGRRAPQDLPASHLLLAAAFAAYAAATCLLGAVTQPWDVAIEAALVDAAVLPAFLLAVLWLRSVPRRWLQTLTAMTGVGALFTAAAIIPVLVVTRAPGSAAAAAASFAALVLVAWNVLALAHILRHAMSIPFPAGALVALAYVAVSTAVVGRLVPEAVA